MFVMGKRIVSIKSSKTWIEVVVWTSWTDMEACYKEFVCVESVVVILVVVVLGGFWIVIMMIFV